MSMDDDTSDETISVYDAADVGRAVKALRRRRQWTQTDLADWLGVHRVTVSKLEQGGTVDLPLAIRALSILGARMTIEPRVPSSRRDG